MLEKSMYDSWASRIHLFIKGKKHGRMMLDSIDNGPLVYPTLKKMGKLDLRNTSNSLKHNNFKMIVMFKQRRSFFMSSTRCSCAGIGNRGIATTSKGNVAAGPPRVLKCYNCQGEGHMVRQCTQPKWPRNAAWFKEKLMLAKVQEAGQILDEKDDLDAYDSDWDDLFLAKVVLMDNLSNYDPEVLFERIQPTLYDGSVIAKEHAMISVIDDEETLILEEDSQSKMHDKQNDLLSIEQKIKISSNDYSKLNKIKEDFGKRFSLKNNCLQNKLFVAAHDEKWVPSAERVKFSSTNIRLETTVPQKEETFQVVTEIITNSTCFKDFTISADVPEIFMQQFWYIIKKVQDTDSYEFLLANKKCTINAEVFRTILGICLRVEGVDFTNVPDDDIALPFPIDLGYKGPLNRRTNIFVDRIQHPWRALAAIINKCLSGKTASNDKLKKSRIDILKEKRSIRENMPYPRFTKIVINHSLKKHKSLTNLNHKHFHTIKDEGIVRKLKFVRIADDNIISDDLDVALELAKSISQTDLEKAEATRKVHATHARIVTESAKKKSSDRSSKSVVIQDTLSTPKSKPTTSKTKLKDQEAVDIMQALKENKKTSRRQPGTGAKLGVLDKDKNIPEEKVILECRDEQDSEFFDDDNDDTSEAKDDAKTIELPPSSSSLFVSSGFGDQFVKLSSDSSLVSTIKDSADADVSS
nr:hypothetical protein [Tanacetum cinerariifolium]